jgi:hypothetical protein
MAQFSIDDFKTKGLKYGGARPNLFEVNLTFPFDTNGVQSRWTAKSTFLPASISSSITVHYLGRAFKYPGERAFPQWTVTFINDEDFKLRNLLEKWADYISGFNKIGQTDMPLTGHQTHLRRANYQSKAEVYQLSKSGNKTKLYKFHGLYPVTITDIALSWDSPNTIEEFTTTFDYQYYTTNYETINPDSINTITPHALT